MIIIGSDYYKRELRAEKDDLANYEKRKSQLETIRNNYSVFDGYAADLNSYCSASSSSMQCGVVISGGSNDTGILFRNQDNGSWDENMANSRNYINVELRAVQDRINELQASINRLNKTIASEEKMEKELKEKSQTC